MFRIELDEHLALGLLELRHRSDLLNLMARNRQHLRGWFPDFDVDATEQGVKRRIRQVYEGLARGEGFAAGIFFDGVLCGYISQNDWNGAARSCALEYWLDAAFQGYGLITQTIAAVIDIGFGEQGLERIEIRIAVDNTRSRAVMDGLDIPLEGIARGAERRYGRQYDQAVYGVTPAIWREVREARDDVSEEIRARREARREELALRARVVDVLGAEVPIEVTGADWAYRMNVDLKPPFDVDDDDYLLRRLDLMVFRVEEDETMAYEDSLSVEIAWAPAAWLGGSALSRHRLRRFVRAWARGVERALGATDGVPDWFDERLGMADLALSLEDADAPVLSRGIRDRIVSGDSEKE